MKQDEIEVGRTYVMKVSGRLVDVTVLEVLPEGRAGRKRRQWVCRNLATGRKVLARSAQRFRAARPDDRPWYVAIGPHCWGRGRSKIEAIYEMEKAGGGRSEGFVVKKAPDWVDEPYLDEFGRVCAKVREGHERPEGAPPRWPVVADRRTAAQKERGWLE